MAASKQVLIVIFEKVMRKKRGPRNNFDNVETPSIVRSRPINKTEFFYLHGF